MARRKLEKFADLHSYPNVYEYGYAEFSSPEVAGEIAGGWSQRAFDADRPLKMLRTTILAWTARAHVCGMVLRRL